MSQFVLDQLPLLQLLVQADPSTRKNILKHANYDLTSAIVECVHNIILGNLRIANERLKKLKRHKKLLRQIKSSDSKWKHKKKLIVQSGGSFLPILLPPVISFILEKIIN